MSDVSVDYLNSVITELQAMRGYEAMEQPPSSKPSKEELHAIASMALLAVLNRFPLLEKVGIMELVKFKMTIEALPENFWPTPDVLKKP